MGQHPSGAASLSFLVNSQEGEPHVAEPGCETSSEESLGTDGGAHSSQPTEPKTGAAKAPMLPQLPLPPPPSTSPMPDNFTTYFPRVLKQVHKGPSLLQEATSVMDSFVKVIFEHITDEASRLARSPKRTTITSREIQTAVHLLLPGEIGKCAVSQTSKAVIRYTFHQ